MVRLLWRSLASRVPVEPLLLVRQRHAVGDQAAHLVAPDIAGSYVLELDPVFEHVAWFSERNGGKVHRAAVRVVDEISVGEP